MKVIGRAHGNYGPLYCIWSDNGVENEGDFASFLKSLGVEQAFT